MRRTLNRLKPLAVEKTKSPGRHADGCGLYMVVKPGPRKSWTFIYRRESKRYDASNEQSGKIYIKDGLPYMYLMTIDAGEVRHIVVSRTLPSKVGALVRLGG